MLTSDLILSSADLENLHAVEDILMIGYPNGIWDSHNNSPIFRRGITATHPANDYEGRKEFLIDAACFPGSSGSPVLLYNVGSYSGIKKIVIGTRIKLLGILWGGPQQTTEGEIVPKPVPTAVRPIVLSQIPINLGYVIHASCLRDFDSIIINQNLLVAS